MVLYVLGSAIKIKENAVVDIKIYYATQNESVVLNDELGYEV